MAQYLITRTQEVLVEADSASEARAKGEAVYYVRPGFDKELLRAVRTTSINVEKVR